MTDKTQPQTVPVTYIDQHYQTRIIKAGRDDLHIKNGRITVTDQAQIKVLDKLYGLTREDE